MENINKINKIIIDYKQLKKYNNYDSKNNKDIREDVNLNLRMLYLISQDIKNDTNRIINEFKYLDI
tara:strand:+ start:1681 stop:1878 length:198 start_codon:yes stop_codon:yes gene_type:complete